MPLNQVSYDFQNTRIDVAGQEIFGVVSLGEYGTEIESEKEFGAGREAYDSTEGTANAVDVDMELKEFAYRNLIEALGPGYMTKAARFDVSNTFSHVGEPTFTDTLQRCRIIKDAHNYTQGAEGLVVTITIQVMKVLKGTAGGQIDPLAAATA